MLPKDLEIAQSVDNDVYKYLAQRQNAAISLHDYDEGDLNLDDWEETNEVDDGDEDWAW